ncbi:hypothetical protein [uncultured Methylophaga sp.]|uniref:plasmid mobilization protein n=1 Tax=uncultured Methylophaga sp. TaxID=285271 RepID=UPI00262AF3E0|nr:hypothetical protein [uncultured Methylophaga sp.]
MEVDKNDYDNDDLTLEIIADQINRLREKQYLLKEKKDAKKPKATNTGNRTKVITVRVSEQEYAEITEDSEMSGLTISNYTRKRVIGYPVHSQMDMKTIKTLRDLIAKTNRMTGMIKHVFLESQEGKDNSDKTASILLETSTLVGRATDAVARIARAEK